MLLEEGALTSAFSCQNSLPCSFCTPKPNLPVTPDMSGEGNGNPFQCDSCLANPMDRGAWQATVHGVARVGHDLVTKPPPPPGMS